MGEESYVLCLWGGRLWPAKVLVQRDQKPRRRKDIALEILGEEKRVSIPESQTWPLTQDRIDSLSLQLDQDVAQPMRELRYRKALRLAINVISTGDPCSSPTVRTQRKSCRLNLTGSPPAPTAVPRSSVLPCTPASPKTRLKRGGPPGVRFSQSPRGAVASRGGNETFSPQLSPGASLPSPRWGCRGQRCDAQAQEKSGRGRGRGRGQPLRASYRNMVQKSEGASVDLKQTVASSSCPEQGLETVDFRHIMPTVLAASTASGLAIPTESATATPTATTKLIDAAMATPTDSNTTTGPATATFTDPATTTDTAMPTDPGITIDQPMATPTATATPTDPGITTDTAMATRTDPDTATATPTDPGITTPKRRRRGRPPCLQTSSPASTPETNATLPSPIDSGPAPGLLTPKQCPPHFRRRRQLLSSTPNGLKAGDFGVHLLRPSESPGPEFTEKQRAELDPEQNHSQPPKRGRGRPKGGQGRKKAGSTESPPVAKRRKRARGEAGRADVSPVHSCNSSAQPLPRCRARFEPTEDSGEASFSSDLSIELSLQEDSAPHGDSLLLEEGDDEGDDEELPSFLLQMETRPLSIAEGKCVWCKFRNYPFWPAMVKSINHKHKKASVVFIDDVLLDKNRRRKGFSVSLRTLKPFDCEEKNQLLVKAREKYNTAINWCLELISDYRIRIACGSFSGSFMDYFADDISCPVRKMHSGAEVTFPSKLMEEEGLSLVDRGAGSGEEADQEDLDEDQLQGSKKLLPDRSKAARNRANEKLVHFIIRKRGAERRLQAVISGREPSRWLRSFLRASHTVVDTYLEDEGQLDQVYEYLRQVFESAPSVIPRVAQVDDSIKFIMDVLLPEAIIHAIAGVEKLSLEKAEDKYLKGPCISKREREEFDLMIEQQLKMKARGPRFQKRREQEDRS